MILRNVTDTVIYSDSDVIFLKPIDELWQYFDEFNDAQVAAISPTTAYPLGGSVDNENFIPQTSGLFQINSGVSVLITFNLLFNVIEGV